MPAARKRQKRCRAGRGSPFARAWMGAASFQTSSGDRPSVVWKPIRGALLASPGKVTRTSLVHENAHARSALVLDDAGHEGFADRRTATRRHVVRRGGRIVVARDVVVARDDSVIRPARVHPGI